MIVVVHTGPIYPKSCPDHRLPLPLIAHSAAVTPYLRWIRGKARARVLRLAKVDARQFEELVVGLIRSNIPTEGNIRSLVNVVDEQMDDVKTITAYAKDMSRFLQKSELTERRAFIETFVKEIELLPDNAVVRYTMRTLAPSVFRNVPIGNRER